MVAEERKVATVFGGSGFVGRYIVKRLAQRGYIVRVGVRDPDRANFLKPMGNLGQIVPMAASVRDAAAVAALVAGAEVVVNCVGILYETGSQTFRALHAEAPGRIGRAAATAGAKHVVHVSAIGADPASPSVYARTKAEGEAALRAAYPAAVVLRPSIVFGPEDDFFNQFAALAQVLPALPLFGGGTTRFQPVYVGDVAEAAMAALDRAEAAGNTYELGGPRIYTFREILEFILRTTGRKRFLISIPYSVGALQARLFELLPKPLLTRDQLILLQRDNVVSPGALTLADLGITPKAVEAIVPTYLARFRRGGPRAPAAA
ncbi:complex I NDUFA9 subunit family protein [Elioraea thermophila]|uniref:complex I NDUFA9 subunit family protein n=1 Tax=Elioraea thermophila TaxID=2185104 RepID=UPI000DF123BB|nr:complex I NDUFA9 subunit family protein [Elioraea thermophila]